ncbi:MAG: nucleotidyl transferase AbiEii/AbiGii toxin family protein [Bacteroidales bacterium]|nr:nucleotidyl transferase AbiEii/AbiGii toxin family protein [Bacteroidales bacterium]
MDDQYTRQVALLLRIIPELNNIPEFAMHGGTAINLFHHDMPRLSVDIDLTYIPFDGREKDLQNIGLLLEKLSDKLRKTIPNIQINAGPHYDTEMKLFCRHKTVEVKIEVNTINRGVLKATEQYTLCTAAQEHFNMFCEMTIVPEAQLFGGKMVAALDRQHPRDLFDTKKKFDKTSLTPELMEGFLFCLCSSKRPFIEILKPNFLNHESALKNQFLGMSAEPFTYTMFKHERKRLIASIHNNLISHQKQMLISFAEGQPDWLYKDWSKYPGIAWKLKNINNLKHKNPQKFKNQIKQLKELFY